MKHLLLPFLCLSLDSAALTASEADDRRANTVILDAVAVQNLRIQTVEAEPGEFEETIFALGRIEVYPGRRAAISSRIAGRALDVFVKLDHAVQKGERALTVESRQMGDPPSVITLTAPLSGLVNAVHVVVGEPVSPDKILAEIIDVSEVYALARVPEHLASRLRRGQTAHVRVVAASDDFFRAELEHLGAVADPASGTVEAAFHVENPDLVLRPGMRAEFSIVTSRRTGVTMVLRSALQGTPADRFVYVRDFELAHAFVKTPVVVGQTNDRFVEIVRGLFPADEVVTQGAYSLAFAGAGSVSLKDALDAAHGHEHNADGSEMTGASKAGGRDVHDHHDHEHPSRFWMIVSAVLFIALIAVSFLKKPVAPSSNP